jgi:hypothetical protein
MRTVLRDMCNETMAFMKCRAEVWFLPYGLGYMDKSETASPIEVKYRERIDAMTPKERIACAASLFQWTQETIARQIIAKSGPMDSEQLKWLVAMRQYGADEITREMIQKALDNVFH